MKASSIGSGWEDMRNFKVMDIAHGMTMCVPVANLGRLVVKATSTTSITNASGAPMAEAPTKGDPPLRSNLLAKRSTIKDGLITFPSLFLYYLWFHLIMFQDVHWAIRRKSTNIASQLVSLLSQELHDVACSQGTFGEPSFCNLMTSSSTSRGSAMAQDRCHLVRKSSLENNQPIDADHLWYLMISYCVI